MRTDAIARTHESDWPESWRISQHYDELEIYGSRRDLGYTYLYQARRRHTLELIRSVARTGDRVLDVAAAQGNFSIALADSGYAVTWNDIRIELIDFVKLKYAGTGIEYRPGNVFDFDAVPQYDVALVAEVIEHVAHPDQFLTHVAKLVRPGGHLVLTTPNGEYFRNRLPRFSDCRDFEQLETTQFGPDADDHIFLLHPDEIHALARASGLEVIECRAFGNPLTCGYLRTAPLLRVMPKSLVDKLESASGRLQGALRDKIHTSLTVLLRKP